MSKNNYFYDITGYRLSNHVNVLKDDWDIDDIKNVDGFVRFVDDDDGEVVESTIKIDDIRGDVYTYEQVKGFYKILEDRFDSGEGNGDWLAFLKENGY